jgi:hypothetical protein
MADDPPKAEVLMLGGSGRCLLRTPTYKYVIWAQSALYACLLFKCAPSGPIHQKENHSGGPAGRRTRSARLHL